MALDLVVGALLGVFFDQIRNEIWRVKDNVAMFKPELEKLEQTLDVLYPVIKEIEELNRRLNRPNHGKETIILRRLLEDGTKLVCKCSKIPRWDFLKQSRYRLKLMELDKEILRFHDLYVQAHMWRDQRQILLCVQQMTQMMIMSLNQQGFSNLTIGLTASSGADSSGLTVGLTASSTDSSYKLKIVFKVDMQCQKCKVRALNIVAAVEGVSCVGLEGDDKQTVVVIGDQVDAVHLGNCLREKVGQTYILSVAAA